MKAHAKHERELQNEYLRILRETLIPAVLNSTSKIVWAHPSQGVAAKSHLLPQGVEVTAKPAPLLGEQQAKNSYVRSATWPEEGFHASRFPLLICVLDGEIDLRIGVTEHLAQEYSLPRRHGYQIWRIPAGSICVISPDTPYDNGDRPHWCRPHMEKARSKLHWMHIVPVGALLHTCQTTGTQHDITRFLCVRDWRLVMQSELLCEGLAEQTQRAHYITLANLSALLWRVEQGIATAQLMGMELYGMEHEPARDDRSIESAAVRRAQHFIQSRIHEKLTVESIASAAYGSASWLNRQFQAELGKSVMQYVIECRITEAKLLLADTDLPVTQIGELVGFPDPSYFSQIFSRKERVSPLQFRRKIRPKS